MNESQPPVPLATNALDIEATVESLGQLNRLLEANLFMAQERVKELEGLINTPQTEIFLDAVRLEAAHQQERWGAEHDVGKSPHSWYWLLDSLSGKAVASLIMGDTQKGLHYIITSAATLLNWHRHVTGKIPSNGPGITGLKTEASNDANINPEHA